MQHKICTIQCSDGWLNANICNERAHKVLLRLVRSACRGASCPHGTCSAANGRAAPHHCGGPAGAAKYLRAPWQHGPAGPRERRTPHAVLSTSAAGLPAGLASQSYSVPSAPAGSALVLLLCDKAVMLRRRASRMRTARRAGRSAARRCGRLHLAGALGIGPRLARAAAGQLAAAQQQRGRSGGRLVRCTAEELLYGSCCGGTLVCAAISNMCGHAAPGNATRGVC